jgi:hypothetical protein
MSVTVPTVCVCAMSPSDTHSGSPMLVAVGSVVGTHRHSTEGLQA